MGLKNKLFIILSLVVFTSIFFICSKGSDKATILDEVKLKDIEEENSMFAIMLQKENGGTEYEQSDSESWPTDGYTFNSEKSGCLDSDGKKISDVQLNYEDGKVKVETGSTSYCYIYFDKKSLIAGNYVIQKVPEEQLKDIGDMKRFHGTNEEVTNNYICFGTTNKDDCIKSNSNYLYRIIGIDGEGRLKIIKSTKLPTDSQWHNKYSSVECASERCTWEKSTINNYLNTYGFYNNNLNTYITTDWKSKIDINTWNVGDVKNDSPQNANIVINAEKENLLEGTENNKIGLIYLSDYYYAYNDGKGITNCSNLSCTSWLTDIGNMTWTMTRYGLYSNGTYHVWCVELNAKTNYPDLSYTGTVRPVFYLTAGTKISSGTGNLDDPFIIN